MVCGSASSRQRADLSASPVMIPQARTVIEYRKDGAVSKMRSHKGNIPVLPQTKLCPHCPAKFTRTTHLNRHMRTRKSLFSLLTDIDAEAKCTTMQTLGTGPIGVM